MPSWVSFLKANLKYEIVTKKMVPGCWTNLTSSIVDLYICLLIDVVKKISIYRDLANCKSVKVNHTTLKSSRHRAILVCRMTLAHRYQLCVFLPPHFIVVKLGWKGYEKSCICVFKTPRVLGTFLNSIWDCFDTIYEPFLRKW